MKVNKHNQAIPTEKLDQAQAKIVEAANLLKPYLLALTPAEKQELPKMGPKTLNFVEESYAYENPELVPPYLEMGEFDTDFADAHGLWVIYNRIRQVEEGIADTQISIFPPCNLENTQTHKSTKKCSHKRPAMAQILLSPLGCGS